MRIPVWFMFADAAKSSVVGICFGPMEDDPENGLWYREGDTSDPDYAAYVEARPTDERERFPPVST